MDHWLPRQAEHMARSWEGAIERYYPMHLETWTNPVSHLRALREEWNTLEAATALDWQQHLGGNANIVLDLGCGAGWLSAVVSKLTNVKSVFALDSSIHNLSVMLPEIVRLMGGVPEKIRPIHGLFYPLLLESGSLDLVVASSAVHHAPEVLECVKECYRVLKPGGVLLVLNECPLSNSRYLATAVARFVRVLWHLTSRKWPTGSTSIAADGLITDRYLGDRSYCLWHWKEIFAATGFVCEVIHTPYPFYKNNNGWRACMITHFVARKA